MAALMCTCRVKEHGKAPVNAMRKQNKAWIYCVWHDNNLISVWTFRSEKIIAMVSNSKDGEIITRVIEMLGNSAIRGSTSRGAMQAAQQALRALKKNQVIAITPDGPRGPKYHLQEGVLYLAAMTNSPIIPVHLECSRQWKFNSWDHAKLPKPFAQVHVVYGEPIQVTPDEVGNEERKEQARLRVQRQMMENVETAQRLAM